jgi:nucleoside phosphorylase
MTGILFTSAEEAAPFVEEYGETRLQRISQGEFVAIGDDIMGILGIGKIKATLSTERFLREYNVDRVVHVGTCLALSDGYDVGTLVGASFVLEGDRVQLDTPSYPRMPLECPYETDAMCTMVTQDHAIADDEERTYWARLADVNDTSSYAVAYVAAQNGVPCHVAKAVTSQFGVDSGTFQDDRRNGYNRIASFLQTDVLKQDHT